jgi:hypothetical protein
LAAESFVALKIAAGAAGKPSAHQRRGRKTAAPPGAAQSAGKG